MVLGCDNLWSGVNLFVVKSTGESIKEVKKKKKSFNTGKYYMPAKVMDMPTINMNNKKNGKELVYA